MKKAELQSSFAWAGLCCTAFSLLAAILGLWPVAAVGFACSASCWAYAMRIGDRRRVRLGQKIILKTREFEEHTALRRGRLVRLGGGGLTDAEKAELLAVEVTAANLRTAVTEAIRDV